MRRGFTKKEYKQIFKGAKKYGVVYSKEERRKLKNLTFEKVFVTDEGMMLVKPQ